MLRLFAYLSLLFAIMTTQAQSIDAATRTRVVDRAIAEIGIGYVDAAAAAEVQAVLRAHRAALVELDDGETFANQLTTVMQSAVPDRHLHVEYSVSVLSKEIAPTSDQIALRRAKEARANYGVERVEVLPGNIGYVDLRSFAKTDWAAETLAAAMTLVAHADALIVDLRNNVGGYPGTATLVESYLFDTRTHVVDVFWRDGQRTEQFWTQESVPGARFGGTKPVWILTSKATFSGAEQFAYDLKNLKRATLVGETTGGGANPGKWVVLDDHFGMIVPTGRAISPITHTNWEGVGVEPDVAVEAGQALETAQALALGRLLAEAPDADRRLELQSAVDGIRHKRNSLPLSER